jgi:microcystin degradation protein MlrC
LSGSHAVKVDDAFDMAVGGLIDASARPLVRITGTVHGVGGRQEQDWVTVSFGWGNVLMVSSDLVQIIEPEALQQFRLNAADFSVIAMKSRVHFRRGFHDTGFAKTIILVEPAEPFLGPVRFDALPYTNVDSAASYPYGAPSLPF